jgi:hypothetical protein
MITLQELPAILRDKSQWPEGFEWDYTGSKTCAEGLFNQLNGIQLTSWNGPGSFLQSFGQNFQAYSDITIRAGVKRDLLAAEVMPEHIADDIEEYLAKGS